MFLEILQFEINNGLKVEKLEQVEIMQKKLDITGIPKLI
jgi:hypothetical protein